MKTINLDDLNSRLRTEVFAIERRYSEENYRSNRWHLRLIKAIQIWNIVYPKTPITKIHEAQHRTHPQRKKIALQFENGDYYALDEKSKELSLYRNFRTTFVETLTELIHKEPKNL